MAIIDTNKPNWFGNGGEPLKNGYIWIGEEYKDPKVYPLTVTLQDSAGATFPAAMPLRTNLQGQIAYEGKAVIATVDINHSLRIEDSAGALITDGLINSVAAEGGSVVPTSVRYFQTLAELKAGDVVVNENVFTAGNASNTDNNGAMWTIVAGGTGTADDELFVDLNNGLQAKLNESTKYSVTHRPIAGFTYETDYYSTESYGTVVVTGITDSLDASVTVGPTGSGATVIDTDLDVLPATAEYIDILWYGAATVGADDDLLIYAGTTSGFAKDKTRVQFSFPVITAIGVNNEFRALSRIHLDSNNSFTVGIDSSGGNTIALSALSFVIKGFGTAS